MLIPREWEEVKEPPSELVKPLMKSATDRQRRGLPPGYVNQLEHRLAETESALYAALASLRSLRPAPVIEAKAKTDPVQKQKAARMEEWNQLPLRGWSDMENWQAAMSDQFLIEQSREVPFAGSSEVGYSMPMLPQNDNDTPRIGVDARASSATSSWHPREDLQIGSSYGTELRPSELISPIDPRDHTVAGSEGITSPAEGYIDATREIENHSQVAVQCTMADELSKSKPSIYF